MVQGGQGFCDNSSKASVRVADVALCTEQKKLILIFFEKDPNFDLDVALVGVPFDTATSNRPGARFGPRHIRAESPMVRRRNHATGYPI